MSFSQRTQPGTPIPPHPKSDLRSDSGSGGCSDQGMFCYCFCVERRVFLPPSLSVPGLPALVVAVSVGFTRARGYGSSSS